MNNIKLIIALGDSLGLNVTATPKDDGRHGAFIGTKTELIRPSMEMRRDSPMDKPHHKCFKSWVVT